MSLICTVAFGKANNTDKVDLGICQHDLQSCKESVEKRDSDAEQLKQQATIYKKQRDELAYELNAEISNESSLPGWAYFALGAVFTGIIVKIVK